MYITSGNTQPLELLSQFQLLERKHRTANATYEPRYYAITAGEIEVFPVPDGTYSTELYYYAKIDALSDSNTSNWLLEYFPDAYLYGALVAFCAVSEGRCAHCKCGHLCMANAIGGITADNDKAKFGGSGRRMKIKAY